MRIGYDAKRIIQNNTGLGNYSRYIVEILSGFYDKNVYFLFAPKEKENVRTSTLRFRSNVFFIFPSGIWKKLASLWRVLGIKADLKKQEINIFHGLSNELPIGIHKSGIRSIVTIHDLIFLRFPEYYKPIDRLIYKWKFRYACLKADKIIAISECTKRDLISFFRIPEEKINVVYQGCHPNFAIPVCESQLKEITEKYQLPLKYILFVGSIEPRKNLLLIAKAMKHIPEDIHLVAVGKKTPYLKEVLDYCNSNGLSSRLHIFHGIPFADLPAIYQLSTIFVYPSFFEGFGIPIIEALSSGVPVIAAKGSCLEEAGGPDSFYVNPTDEKELAERVNEILDNPQLASDMIQKGKNYMQYFSDEYIAKKIYEVYQSVKWE